MQRHREDDRRIVLRDSAELAEGLPIVLDVLKDVEGADQGEAAVGEWQGGYFAQHRKTAADLQAGESWAADVDEGRIGNGESGTQAWADFQSGRRRSCERGEERPGVEALRRNHLSHQPERVVEASVRVNGWPSRVLRDSGRYGVDNARDRDPTNPVAAAITLS